ncbi:unnamed protein product [Ectocarpus sp. CCAP 1310/34]|nr:unnamed protein product [Ectocarpus sp. CCAP 1310/34]
MPVRKRAPKEYSFRTASWSCPLTCEQCQEVRANGMRCKNRVCFGTPLCHVHNSLKYGVKAKTSTIVNAGKGLFATRAFPKNSWICPYLGEKTSKDCIQKRYPGDMTAAYAEILPGPEQLHIDSACKRGVASLANGLFNANGSVSSLSRHNCVSRYRPVGDGVPGVWLKSTKPLKIGDEIFNWYGDGGYMLQHNHSTKRRTKAPDTRPC